MNNLSVIIPAYNEGKHIQHNIDVINRVLDNNTEIIVVDDGSTDNTYCNIPNYAIALKNETNNGKGDSIRHGLKWVTREYTAFLDADLEIHPDNLKSMFNYMQENNHWVVIGSKLLEKSNIKTSIFRKICTWGYFSLVKLLFHLPIHDTQTGIKIFRTSLLKEIMPQVKSRRFAFDLELLFQLHKTGVEIIELPVVVNQTRNRMKLSNIWNILIETLIIKWRG
jgi:glycosyltransferase involved in cell wall biosynthesis